MFGVPQYDPSSNTLTADTSSGPSGALWKDLKIADVMRDPSKGRFSRYTPDSLPLIDASSGAIASGLGEWRTYVYQGGTITEPTGGTQGGEAVFASDGDNEGVAIQKQIAKYQIASTKGRLVFEARMRTSTIADTKHGIFCGLLEGSVVAAGVPLATDGTLADKNFIGFHRLEGDGDKLDIVYKADGQTQQSLITDAITLVAATWMKVGFIFDPLREAAKRIQFFYNGIPITSAYVTETLMDAATFPDDVMLDFCFATMNATGSSPGNSSWQWAQIFQEF